MYQYFKTITFILVFVFGAFLFLYLGGKYFMFDFSSGTQVDSTHELDEKAYIGLDAPYFNLESSSGGKINSMDTKGKPLVLAFWSTWNADSIDQIKILDDYSNSMKDKMNELLPRIFLVSSQQDKNTVSNVLRRGGYDLEVLVDQDGSITNLYGVKTLPTTFFIDKDNHIIDIVVGTINKNELEDKVDNIIR